ncbi:MAG: hypothetical protein RL685_4344 [Pseudomonadota bacterium]
MLELSEQCLTPVALTASAAACPVTTWVRPTTDRRSSRKRATLLGASALAITLACSSTQSEPLTPKARAPLPADVVAKAALPLYVQHGEEKLSEPALWQALAKQRVICFGEQHDDPAHHFAQRRALEELAARSAAEKRVLAAGFEMFQKPYQTALSSFVGGTLPEAQFLIDSEYKERWGFDFALYRPLLQVARDNNLEALALNTPRELTRKVGRTGLASLEAGERNQLPELDLTNTDHKAYFDAAMGNHAMPDRKPEDMYAAQVLWDETMAEAAAAWLSRAGENAQLIVFAGSGHCHKSAIPARITRRVQLPVLSVTPVAASQLAQFEDKQRYDWLVVLQDQK